MFTIFFPVLLTVYILSLLNISIIITGLNSDLMNAPSDRTWLIGSNYHSLQTYILIFIVNGWSVMKPNRNTVGLYSCIYLPVEIEADPGVCHSEIVECINANIIESSSGNAWSWRLSFIYKWEKYDECMQLITHGFALLHWNYRCWIIKTHVNVTRQFIL